MKLFLPGVAHPNWICSPTFLDVLIVKRTEFEREVSKPETRVSLGFGQSGKLHSIEERESLEHDKDWLSQPMGWVTCHKLKEFISFCFILFTSTFYSHYRLLLLFWNHINIVLEYIISSVASPNICILKPKALDITEFSSYKFHIGKLNI